MKSGHFTIPHMTTVRPPNGESEESATLKEIDRLIPRPSFVGLFTSSHCRLS